MPEVLEMLAKEGSILRVGNVFNRAGFAKF